MKISQTSGFSVFCQNGDRHHRGFINFKILTVRPVNMTICITLPSLAVIDETISGIWRSCDFSNGFSNFVDFNGRNAQDGQF